MGVVYLAEQSAPLERLVVVGELRMLSFSAAGDLVAVASQGRTAHVWSLPDGVEIQTIDGHREAVTVATLVEGGKTLLTASSDKTVRLWEVRSGALHAAALGHREHVQWAELDPSGERIVTASFDGTARFWPVHVVAFAARYRPRALSTLERAARDREPLGRACSQRDRAAVPPSGGLGG